MSSKRAEQRVRLKERNDRIRAEALKSWNRGFRMEKIIIDLQKQFFLDAYTIEAIIREKGVYKEF